MIRIGIIGTGGRSLAYLPLIKEAPDACVAALCDIDKERLIHFYHTYFNEEPMLLACDYNEILQDATIDTVLILTPDTCHREILEQAVKANKHILLEKPIATTFADAKAMYEAAKNYNKTLMIGFVLRYTPVYSKVKELLENGTLGKVITVTAKEMLDTRHAGSFFRRWHRFSKNNGGLMNAKCSHDLDILHWLIGSEPRLISAFGGNRIFTPDSEAAQRCDACTKYDTCKYGYRYDYYKENYKEFHSTSDLCVYNVEKDIVDHECMNILYENDVVALFELCLVGYEENRFLNIHGTQATLTANFAAQTIQILPLKGEPYTIQCEAPATGHGGGDNNIMECLFHSIQTGENTNHIRSGFLSTATALAGEESMRLEKTVSLKELFDL